MSQVRTSISLSYLLLQFSHFFSLNQGLQSNKLGILILISEVMKSQLSPPYSTNFLHSALCPPVCLEWSKGPLTHPRLYDILHHLVRFSQGSYHDCSAISKELTRNIYILKSKEFESFTGVSQSDQLYFFNIIF